MAIKMEIRAGLHVCILEGAVTRSDWKDCLERLEALLDAGAAGILVTHARGCNLVHEGFDLVALDIVAAESMKDRKGALAFACPEAAVFGAWRQFQLLASESSLRIAVFRDESEARFWIESVCRRVPDPEMAL